MIVVYPVNTGGRSRLSRSRRCTAEVRRVVVEGKMFADLSASLVGLAYIERCVQRLRVITVQALAVGLTAH